MYCAMGVEPTNEMERTSGASQNPSPARLSPWRTLETPSVQPASFRSPAIHLAAEGTFSRGLRISVFPAAIAMGKNHSGAMAGKLNGLIIPTTPGGCLGV